MVDAVLLALGSFFFPFSYCPLFRFVVFPEAFPYGIRAFVAHSFILPPSLPLTPSLFCAISISIDKSEKKPHFYFYFSPQTSHHHHPLSSINCNLVAALFPPFFLFPFLFFCCFGFSLSPSVKGIGIEQGVLL
jgi:hypothetical protein